MIDPNVILGDSVDDHNLAYAVQNYMFNVFKKQGFNPKKLKILDLKNVREDNAGIFLYPSKVEITKSKVLDLALVGNISILPRDMAASGGIDAVCLYSLVHLLSGAILTKDFCEILLYFDRENSRVRKHEWDIETRF